MSVFSESPYQNWLPGKFSENLDKPSLEIAKCKKEGCKGHIGTFSNIEFFQ